MEDAYSSGPTDKGEAGEEFELAVTEYPYVDGIATIVYDSTLLRCIYDSEQSIIGPILVKKLKNKQFVGDRNQFLLHHADAPPEFRRFLSLEGQIAKYTRQAKKNTSTSVGVRYVLLRQSDPTGLLSLLPRL